MPTERDFLSEILANPNDHQPWLILADWLDEQGDRRGELIRLRLELTRAADVHDRINKEFRLRQLLYEENVEPINASVTNSAGIKFVLIPPGRYVMGSPPKEEGRGNGETQHHVVIARAALMSVHPITQQQYVNVMSANPSWFSEQGVGRHQVAGMDTTNFPVERVSWNDAIAFCEKLTAKYDPPLEQFNIITLPPDELWEFACRAGTTTPYHYGHSLASSQANFKRSNASTKTISPWDNRPTPVGSYPPNAFGLFDMHGNVGEWCEDRKNASHVGGWSVRGGTCFDPPVHLRSASRSIVPVGRYKTNGFRCIAIGDQTGD